MKSQRAIAFILAALAIGAATSAARAQSVRPPADIQKDYDQFIVKFRVALKANDGAAVAKLTKFPFYWNEMRDESYFRKNIYSKVFTSKARDCIARGKGTYARAPNGEENFSIFCGNDLFPFTRTSGGFRFAEVGEND